MKLKSAIFQLIKLISKWKNTSASSNFPMALDEKNNRLYIGCRSPAKLRMINTRKQEKIFLLSVVQAMLMMFFTILLTACFCFRRERIY